MHSDSFAFPSPSRSSSRAASQSGFSTLGLFVSALALVAILALAAGYFIQLNSRLALAESQSRLLQVNQALLSQELQIERQIGSKAQLGFAQLAHLAVVHLRPEPSPWILDTHFNVIWNETSGIGVLSIHGQLDEVLARDLQFFAHQAADGSPSRSTPIATQRVAGSPHQRWFEISDRQQVTVTGFEILMRLGKDSSEFVRFTGDLDP